MRSNIFPILLLVSGLSGCSKGGDYLEGKIDPVTYEQPKGSQFTHVSTDFTLQKGTSVITGADVDILWVIDNSGSMQGHQADLQTSAGKFINGFTSNRNLHWKMGIVSTDTSDQPYIGFTPADILNWLSNSPVQMFQAAVGRLGTNGSSTEMSYDPIVNALTQHPDFLRDSAFLALIIATDADEQSYNYRTQAFLDKLTQLKGGNKSLLLSYGLFANIEACVKDNPDEENFTYEGSIYQQLIQGTNGKIYPLCNAGSGDLLANLGKDLVAQITTSSPYVSLDNIPVLNSLRVSYQGTELNPGLPSEGGDWIYESDLNRIRIFNPTVLKGVGQSVRIDYDVAAAVAKP